MYKADEVADEVDERVSAEELEEESAVE